LLYGSEVRPFRATESPTDDANGWVGPVIAICLLVVVAIVCIILTISNKRSKQRMTDAINAKAEARSAPQAEIELPVRSYADESAADPPFAIISQFKFTSSDGVDAYVNAFNALAETRKRYATTFVLTRDATSELKFTATYVFRSSEAYLRHFQDENAASLELRQLMKDYVDFDSASVSVLGAVSPEVQRKIGEMGATNFPIASGYVFRSGANSETPIILSSTFRAKNADSAAAYAAAFGKVAPHQVKFAPTYLLVKDPSDDVTFNELFVFNSPESFVSHYRSKVVGQVLVKAMGDHLDQGHAPEIFAIGKDHLSEECREAFEAINVNYFDEASGYVMSA
jgi:hypothetical protein